MAEAVAKSIFRLLVGALLLFAFLLVTALADFFGGSSGGLQAIWIVLFVLLIWSLLPILARFAGTDDETLKENADRITVEQEVACENAEARAITQYRHKRTVTISCPACHQLISVASVELEIGVGSLEHTVITDCPCHRCAGKYNLIPPSA